MNIYSNNVLCLSILSSRVKVTALVLDPCLSRDVSLCGVTLST